MKKEKMTIAKKTLSLKKETFFSLAENQMKSIKGGAKPGTDTAAGSCCTSYCCTGNA